MENGEVIKLNLRRVKWKISFITKLSERLLVVLRFPMTVWLGIMLPLIAKLVEGLSSSKRISNSIKFVFWKS